MKIEMNEVTGFSKIMSAIVLLGALPVLCFYIGRQYQQTVSVYYQDNAAAVSSPAGDVRYSKYESTNSSSPVQYDSGVKGVAMVGPTCPVSTPGDETTCSDQPLSTQIKFVDQYGEATTTTSADDGTFSISLAPGPYTVEQGGQDLLPSLNPVNVSVAESEYTNINLTFDSGIR